MKVYLILIMFIFINNSSNVSNNDLSKKIDLSIFKNVQIKKGLTKKELILSYKKIDYKLIYTKLHKNKIFNNCFFIFEHEIKNKDFKQNRILIVTKIDRKNNFQILYKLDNIIYEKNYTMTCYSGNNKEAFNKIVTNGNFLTIEQNKCTLIKGEILHEFLTFKYDKVSNDYLLVKYSSVLEQINIGDEYNSKLLTDKEFGEIKLSNFNNEVFDKIKL